MDADSTFDPGHGRQAGDPSGEYACTAFYQYAAVLVQDQPPLLPPRPTPDDPPPPHRITLECPASFRLGLQGGKRYRVTFEELAD